MNVVAASRIVGTFLGYAPGVVHRLDDGTEWERGGTGQEDGRLPDSHIVRIGDGGIGCVTRKRSGRWGQANDHGLASA
jgi:hypothetical protein